MSRDRTPIQPDARYDARTLALLDGIPGVVWEAYGRPDASQQRIDFVSSSVETMLGYSVEEWLGTPNFWLSIVHPDDRDRAARVAAEAFTRGETHVNQFRWMTKDGRAVWVESHSTVMQDDAGVPIGMRGVTLDISARKHTEDELRQAEETLRARESQLHQLISDSPFMLTRCSRDLRYVFVSRAYADMLGRTPADIEGRRITEIMGDEGFATIRPHVEAVLRGERVEYESAVKFAGIGERSLRVVYSPDRGQNGTVTGWIASILDVTEEKQASHARAVVSSIAETSFDAIVTKSLDGIVTSWNPAAQQLFGYTADEIVGQSIRVLIPPERQSEEDDILERIRTGQRVEHFETVRIAKDGRHVHVSVTISPLRDEAGRIVGASKIARDISAVRAAEAERVRLIQEASRLKDDFLATLSHELRTPLNAVLGYARMLRAGVVRADKQARAIETIERNATSLTQIVEDVLDISRIVSGKIRLNVQPVDLPQTVTNAVDAVAPAADARGIRIETVLDPNATPVSGDPERLQQVLWNLLSNAVKFTTRGGRVQVRLARVNSHVEVSVADTGVGIAPEFLPHVFERFRQADAGIARERGGLGLGLSIARQLAEMHGGTIDAASNGVGHGSTFTLTLPLMIVNAVSRGREARVHPSSVAAAQVIPITDLRGVNVLAVDDDVDAVTLIAELLEAAGARVSTARSADDALRAMDMAAPQVLVTDLGMPHVDGFQLLDRVRAHPNPLVRRVPAAALTAYARSEDRVKALRAGFQIHLSKPIDPTELLAAVASLSKRFGREDDTM